METEEIQKKKKKRLFLLDDSQREIMDRTLSYFEGIRFGMTEFQIRNFVVNKVEYPTPFSKWRQAKIELWSRYCGVMETHFSYRETMAKVALAQARIERLKRKMWGSEIDMKKIYDAKIRLLKIKISRNYFSLAVTKKTVKDKLGEMQAFFDIVRENESSVSGDEKAEDEKFWNEKMKKMPGVFRERYDIGPQYDAEEGEERA